MRSTGLTYVVNCTIRLHVERGKSFDNSGEVPNAVVLFEMDSVRLLMVDISPRPRNLLRDERDPSRVDAPVIIPADLVRSTGLARIRGSSRLVDRRTGGLLTVVGRRDVRTARRILRLGVLTLWPGKGVGVERVAAATDEQSGSEDSDADEHLHGLAPLPTS